MKFRFSIFILFILVSVFTSACSGQGLAVSWPGLTTDGETVYLASGPHVYALNASNGGEIWRFPEEPDSKLSFYAAPTLGGDGQLIVGGYDNVLYSLNPQTGQPNSWTFEGSRNRFIGSPETTSNLILIPSSDKNLYALDFGGEKMWSFATQEPIWGEPSTNEKNVYVASLDHYLYAVDQETGQEIWKVDLGGAIVGSPLIVDGLVYAGSFANTLTAVDAETGDIRWTFPTNHWVWAAPVFADGLLYFGSIDGSFYVIDALTGEPVWRDYNAEGGIFSSPIIVDDKIYFATENGNIYAFNTNEELLWSEKVVGKIYTSPISVNNLILIALMESEKLVIAYDENKVERWSYTPGE